MTRFLLTVLLALACVGQSKAQYDLYVEVDVAGTLEEVVAQISETAKYNTTSMKVFGSLNGKDMMFIREMCGVSGFAIPTEGKLRILDLENTYIVESEEPYINLYGVDHTSKYGHFGTCFLYNCQNLEELVLPAFLESIDSLALANCKNLKFLVIPDLVKSIGYGAFVGCEKIPFIKLPDGVTEVGVGAFQQMASLQELTLGDGVEEIDNSLVMGDDSLQVIKLGRSFRKFNPVVFYTAKALNELYVAYGNPYYCSDAGVLYSVSKDTLVTYPPALKTEEFTMPFGLKYVAPYAFYNARFLQTVNCSPELATIDSLAFFGCTSLSEVNLDKELLHIGFGAFGMPLEGKSSLEQLFIPASVYDIQGGAFIFNSSLKSIKVDDNSPYYVADEMGTLFSKDYKRLCHVNCLAEEVDMPEELEEVGDYAFAGTMGMTSLSIPDRVTTIGDGAFAYSEGLSELYLGEGVERVGDMVIDGCVSLENLYLFAPDIPEKNLQPFSFLDESGAVMEQCVLHVLPGKTTSYLTKKGFYSEDWDMFFFSDIVEIDHPEDVAELEVTREPQERAYDVVGRLLKTPVRGVNIITSPGKKTLKRFVR